ncbi:hypothetical protein GCM10009730_66050 [Streptomyces albidochromogenes]
MSALLMKLMPAGSGQLDELIGKARQLGLADMPVAELAGLKDPAGLNGTVKG